MNILDKKELTPEELPDFLKFVNAKKKQESEPLLIGFYEKVEKDTLEKIIKNKENGL